MVFNILFWPHYSACGILVPKPGFWQWKCKVLNHFTTREVPGWSVFLLLFFFFPVILICRAPAKEPKISRGKKNVFLPCGRTWEEFSFPGKSNGGVVIHYYDLSSSHVQIWELDHKEDWAPKNWCFQTVMLEKTLKSPLDSKEIKLVNPKGHQPWIFTGSTDADAEATVLWPPDVKSRLIVKDFDAGKDWGQDE